MIEQPMDNVSSADERFNITLVKTLLSLKGMTQAELSARSGISQSNISGWLNGSSKIISANREFELFNALGVRLDGLDVSQVHKWTISSTLLNPSSPELKQKLSHVLRQLLDTKSEQAQRQLYFLSKQPNSTEGMIELCDSTKPQSALIEIKSPLPVLNVLTDLGIVFDAVNESANDLRQLPNSDGQAESLLNTYATSQHDLLNSIAAFNQTYFTGTQSSSALASQLGLSMMIEPKTIKELDRASTNLTEQLKAVNEHLKQVEALRASLIEIEQSIASMDVEIKLDILRQVVKVSRGIGGNDDSAGADSGKKKGRQRI